MEVSLDAGGCSYMSWYGFIFSVDRLALPLEALGTKLGVNLGLTGHGRWASMSEDRRKPSTQE